MIAHAGPPAPAVRASSSSDRRFEMTLRFCYPVPTATLRASLVVAFVCATAVAQQPRIDRITPAEGPIAGGTVVTIDGANFGDASVTLDRKPILPLARSDTSIRLEMPAHDNGYAIVAITREADSSYTRFLYVPPPLAALPPGSITTVAGIGKYGGEYGPATEATVQASATAFDATGALYFSDPAANRVFRLRSDGVVEAFAGDGYSDGPHPAISTPALDVPMSFPRSIAFDSRGNLIVPDSAYYLWRVDPRGQAELIAGTGVDSHVIVDGVPAKGTAIGFPTFVAVDAADNVYFLDWTNMRIRRIDRNGILTTVAGNGTAGFSGDGGPALSAAFDITFVDLGGLTVDTRGNLLLLDQANRRIRRIDMSTGIIETIVGPVLNGHSLDNIRAIASGPDDAIYVSNAAEIYKRTADGGIVQIASGKRGFSEDGSLLPGAAIGVVIGLSVDPAGNLIISDDDVHRIRRIDRVTGELSTLAGTGPRAFGEGGPATAAALQAANVALGFLPGGELLIADHGRIASVGQDGNLTRFAGSGSFGPHFDVPALAATMSPWSLFVAADGSIDFTNYNLGVYRIDAAGIVRHIGGTLSGCDFSGDGGDAREAGFCQTTDALRDAAGNVLVADTNNNRIRRIDAAGTVTTFAGSGPTNGLERFGFGSTCGDGGPATSACINTPYGLTFDDRGNLFVCENELRIRRIDPAGMISTFAEVRCTKLGWAFGNLFTVANDYVARISRSGEVTPLTARNLGFSGDGGPASQARIFAQKQGHGIVADRDGNLFFSDGDNYRIRAIRYGALLAPPGATIQAAATGSSIRAVVADAHGHPAEGVRVAFAAPASGPSCSLSSSFAVTDESGAATVTCTPNCVGGSYGVTAQPLTASATATIVFTNASVPCRRRTVRR